MRLIDADKITFFNCLAKTGNAVCCHAEGIISKSALEMQPTVKAIPIEWIENWINDRTQIQINPKYADMEFTEVPFDYYEKFTPYQAISILEDWEKENEDK